MFFGELGCGLIWSEWDMWDMWPSLFLMGLLTTFRSVRHSTDFLEFPAMQKETVFSTQTLLSLHVSSAISVSGNNVISLLQVESTFWKFDLRNDLTSRHSDLRGSTPLLPWRPHRAWRKHEAQDPKALHDFNAGPKRCWITDEWPMNFIHISQRPSLLPSQDGKMTHIHCSEKGASLPPRWIVSVHLEIDPAMHVHVSHDLKKPVEPHLKKLFLLKMVGKNTKSSDWIANIWDFLWHFSTKTNIPTTARARSERSDPAQGWVPKLPGWLPWMWSKPDVCDSWQDSTPKKTMKPKLWSFALYLSTQNVFLSFFVSVFLCSACFFNLSERLATPPTSDSSGESRENRRAHRNAKSQGSPPWEPWLFFVGIFIQTWISFGETKWLISIIWKHHGLGILLPETTWSLY